jgi:hypothetical protein
MNNADTISAKISSISKDLEVHDQVKEVVEILSELAGFHYVGLFIVDETKGLLCFYFGSGEVGQKLALHEWKFSLESKNLWTNAVLMSEVRLNNWLTQESFGMTVSNLESSEINSLEQWVPRNEFFPAPLVPVVWQLLVPVNANERLVALLEFISNDPDLNIQPEAIRDFVPLSSQIGKLLTQGSLRWHKD